MSAHSKIIIEALYRMLRPLVRILLRQGVSSGTLTELVRRVYVEVAEEDFKVNGRKMTTSRISVLTGLNRKEVARIQSLPPVEESDFDERYNRAARVISGWMRDKDFLDTKGDPAVLAYEGEGHTFAELVKRYSGDMPVRAVADELLRVGAIERNVHDEFQLTARGYVTNTSETDKLQILGTDTRDLIETIDHNLTHPPADARFQRKVMYDAIPVEYIPQFRRLSARLGQSLLEQLNTWLAEHDKEDNPEIEGSGRARLGLGIYLLEETLEEGETDANLKKVAQGEKK